MLIKAIPSKRTITSPICTGPAKVSDPLHTFMDVYLSSERKKVLYIHTPFCHNKCKYCKWQSSVGNISDVRKHFEETLVDQIHQFEKILNTITFDEVYFGGGTPTIASAKILEKFFSKIPRFRNIKNKCIECSPDTLDEEHIALLKEYDFDFISMGIQTLDPNIAYKQNRYYVSHQEVVNIADYLRSTGMYFNFDMICFLNHGDVRDIAQFNQDIQFLMDIVNPSSITIHQEYYTYQSLEKTKLLIKLLDRMIHNANMYSFHDKWKCVNSPLDNTNNLQVLSDSIYRAEYKIASERFEYMHHLWDKYNLNLKNQYTVLSLGSTMNHPLSSFVDDMIYDHEKNLIFDGPWNMYPEKFFDQLHKFRAYHGWE